MGKRNVILYEEMKASKGNRKRSQDNGSTGTINSSISPVHSTIEKLDQEISKMVKHITDLENDLHHKNKELVSLKNWLKTKEAISNHFEEKNVQLTNELFEASQSLNQNTGQIQEIVRNVLEIKHLKEQLNSEKEKNKQLKEELELFEASQSLNQNTGQIQEIVR